MLGAIIGDMVGSLYEFHPIKRKDFNIYDKRMRMTDDSLLTIAICKVLLNHYPFHLDESEIKNIQKELCEQFFSTWRAHQGAGWGGRFFEWCVKASKGNMEPYGSYGNGSAMRISSVAWLAKNEEEVKLLSNIVTEITHNHPEGLKGAEAVAIAIYLALHGASKEEIRERMINDYYPEIALLDYDDLVANYRFSEICQKSVPQAIFCFLESNSLEDAIRNCVGIGGDSDTNGAMAGAIAEAYYQKDKLSEFEDKFMYFLIDPEVEKLIKMLHYTINSKKFDR